MDSGAVFTSKTGIEVFQRSYGCPREARAGALLLHGLGEHSGRHEELLGLFVRHGIYCRTFDWPGHGRSTGQRGHLESMETITHLVHEQLELLGEALGPDKCRGLLGHSMGGFFALYFLAHDPDLAKFAWIGSPLIDPTANVSWFKRRLALFIDRVWPRFTINSGVDALRCRPGPPMRTDPLMHRQLTVRLGAILVEAARELQERVSDINPDLILLMTHGSEDIVCPPELSRSLFDRLPTPAKTYHLLDGALHEPFLGDSREEFYQAVERWLVEDLDPYLTTHATAKSSI